MDSADSCPDLTSAAASCCQPVTDAESGQKLLRFLERRLALPEALLHRWVRTGQIRINGSRCKPFDRLKKGDQVRLPPFAGALACQAKSISVDDAKPGNEGQQTVDNQTRLIRTGLDLLGNEGGVWALFKPAGLPVQSGTGQPDSIAARLHEAWRDCYFQPAPAHRLDRDTSGVLLAGGDFEALRSLQEAFRDGALHKEYLVWVEGSWPVERPVLLKDWLRKEKTDGVTRMCLRGEGLPFAREALCIVNPIAVDQKESLLQVRLLTGRTHQIRVQLAGVGYPALGDGKYGRGGTNLKLHSLRVILQNGREFSCLPQWEGKYAVGSLPKPLLANYANDEVWEKILPRFCECVDLKAAERS